MPLKNIDLQKYVSATFGNGWTVRNQTGHVWGWQRVMGPYSYGLDMHAAAQWVHGPGYHAVAVGLAGEDWKAYRASDENNHIQPVVIVPVDKFWSQNDLPACVAGVKNALDNYKSVLNAVKNWYLAQVGKTFKLLDTIAIYSPQSSAWWEALCNNADRFDYMAEVAKTLRSSLPSWNANNHHICTVFANGAGADAANDGNISAIPPFCCTQRVAADKFVGLLKEHRDAMHCVAHELSHAFGLDHADKRPANEKPDNFGNSITLWGWHDLEPAILIPVEKAHLYNLRFFNA